MYKWSISRQIRLSASDRPANARTLFFSELHIDTSVREQSVLQLHLPKGRRVRLRHS